MPTAIRLVGFDADDTLWRCQDDFDAAQVEFERIVSRYVALDARALDRMRAIEGLNIGVFGYGVKGMALSMIEAAIEITQARIAATDLHRIVEMAKHMLRRPVELLDGVHEAVAAIAVEFEVVLITKGDLFHQETKVQASGLAGQFRRIEVVSEKDEATYRRLLGEFGIEGHELLMIGNSLRSDIAPVLALGGWGLHTPYHLEWHHEAGVTVDAGHPRLRRAASAHEWPALVRELAAASAVAS